MRLVLVGSRSFGTSTPVGIRLLEAGGFAVRLVGDEDRPLDAVGLERIVARERPAVLLCGAEPVTREVLTASPALRLVQKHGVGVDNIDLDAAREAGILVANAPGTNTQAVADLTIALMLALLRDLVPAVSSTRHGDWLRYIGHELGRMTVGVVGTGRVGKAVIRRLSGFGSRILGHDVVEDAGLAAEHGLEYATLPALLSEADLVTLHAPLVEETRGLIGAKELELMKPTAYLVNVARGELVDEAALARHLATGRLAGAAVDVFAAEPPQHSPLIGLPNVLATPHIAAYTVEAMEMMDAACARTILDLFAGRGSPNVLDPTLLPGWSP